MTATNADLYLRPDRNLALELVRATEAAAIRAVPFIGKGDKNGADKAAVDAMRKFLGTVNFANAVYVLCTNDLSHTTGLHIPVDAGVAAAFLR